MKILTIYSVRWCCVRAIVGLFLAVGINWGLDKVIQNGGWVYWVMMLSLPTIAAFYPVMFQRKAGGASSEIDGKAE